MRQFEHAVAAFMATSPPRVLCRTPGEVGAVFIPTHPEEWFDAAPRAKRMRLALYALCARCFALPEAERTKRVEAAISGNRDVPVRDLGTR